MGSKQRITGNCSRTEYGIFLKERAYPNVGNWKMGHTFWVLDLLTEAF